MVRVICVALAVLLLPVAAAAGAGNARYELVHGCYALQAPDGKFVARSGDGYAATAADAASAAAFRMQATRLGSYMLYSRDKDYLGVQDGAVRAVTQAGPAADLDVTGDGPFTLSPHEGGDVIGTYTFVKADGCLEYPEA